MGTYEHGNKAFDSVMDGEFLEYQLLKQGSAHMSMREELKRYTRVCAAYLL